MRKSYRWLNSCGIWLLVAVLCWPAPAGFGASLPESSHLSQPGEVPSQRIVLSAVQKVRKLVWERVSKSNLRGAEALLKGLPGRFSLPTFFGPTEARSYSQMLQLIRRNPNPAFRVKYQQKAGEIAEKIGRGELPEENEIFKEFNIDFGKNNQGVRVAHEILDGNIQPIVTLKNPATLTSTKLTKEGDRLVLVQSSGAQLSRRIEKFHELKYPGVTEFNSKVIRTNEKNLAATKSGLRWNQKKRVPPFWPPADKSAPSNIIDVPGQISFYNLGRESAIDRKTLNKYFQDGRLIVLVPIQSIQESYFTVRFGAPSTREGAEDLAALVTKTGFEPEIVPEETNFGLGYWVQHGTFSTRPEVELFIQNNRSRLDQAGEDCYKWVHVHPIYPN